MSLKFFDKLSQNFIELLNDKDDYNVIIEVENKKSFTAHSNVLKCRSPSFRKELENITPDENNIKTIIKSDISNEIFEEILNYIYGGIIDLEYAETRFIFDLMMTSNEFELEELTKNLEILLIETKLAKELETFLIETESSWLMTNFSLVYHSIFSRINFEDLQLFCNDIATKYPTLIFDAEDFPSFQESVLISFLERDDLQMEEIKIWEYIIEWGIAQNPTLPENLNEWVKENFTALQITLKQCLPLIRYFHISSTDMWNKLKPYKKILDKKLWEDLKQYFLAPGQPIESFILPPRTAHAAESFSVIITNEHIAEISSWIDHSFITYSLINIPYKFKLIFRGSINGFEPQKFWSKCHGYSNTVVIMKVKETDEILGGYNPLTWDANSIKNTWKVTNDSFIFSLKTGKIQNSILSRVKNPQIAIGNAGKDLQKICGPYFGNHLYMNSPNSNFTSDDSCICTDCGHYEFPIRTTKDRFSIVDYEVFEIIKKNS
ncbi:hypothetical protein Glove_352g46 [Diversispora epigaea]|uniref:BTB domain-containing protein n=1 Tax=Diversispora epigaea TaxID=1348612 RepID=A0A397HC53_9GLOM|nr:hypothetical protein Glove_352g46 [Diversispora epigaea]